MDALHRLLESGLLPNVAADLERHIGLEMHKLRPKQAVLEFFERYTGITDAKELKRHFYYQLAEVEWPAGFVVSELHTPVFYNRVFIGQPKRYEQQAKASAATAFATDVDA